MRQIRNNVFPPEVLLQTMILNEIVESEAVAQDMLKIGFRIAAALDDEIDRETSSIIQFSLIR
jgi:hypothetical protein